MTLEAAAGDTTQPSPAPFNPEVPRISESFRYPAPPVAIAPAGRRANNAARRRGLRIEQPLFLGGADKRQRVETWFRRFGVLFPSLDLEARARSH